MIETIVIAMLVAKMKGYKLKPLFMSWEVYPVLVFVIIYLFLNVEVFFGNYYLVKYTAILESAYISSYFFVIIKYRQYISAVIGSMAIFIGTILNKVAISANFGKMPVFPTLSYLTGYVKQDTFIRINGIHILGNEASKFIFLTDIIDIGYSILSIGDIFIRVFTFVIIFNTIKSTNKTVV